MVWPLTKLKAKVKTLERGAETHEQALQTTKARLNEVCEQKDSLVSENARLHELVVHLTQKHQKVLRGQEDADVDDSVSSDGVHVIIGLSALSVFVVVKLRGELKSPALRDVANSAAGPRSPGPTGEER